jgi:F-type H+-transporting ATPase subunit delta
MDIGVMSVRYARALLKSAMETKIEDKVYEDMQALSASYIQVPQLRFTIDNPMLAKNKKETLLQTAAGGSKIQERTKRFIDLVLREDRESTLQFMAASYITLYRQQKNITRGKLITATAVTPETEQKMKQMVESRTQGTVEFQTEVNPEIIGGFILEYDTYRMDASVQTKLRNILTQLKK